MSEQWLAEYTAGAALVSAWRERHGWAGGKGMVKQALSDLLHSDPTALMLQSGAVDALLDAVN